jgi:hypothetical protein
MRSEFLLLNSGCHWISEFPFNGRRYWHPLLRRVSKPGTVRNGVVGKEAARLDKQHYRPLFLGSPHEEIVAFARPNRRFRRTAVHESLVAVT